MSRARVAIGLAAVALGTAWLSGTVAALPRTAIAAAPYVLIGVALLAVAQVVAPPASLIGPGLVLAAGTVWLVVRQRLLADVGSAEVVAGLVVVSGCLVALVGSRPQWRPERLRRHVAVLWGRYSVTGRAPAKLAVTALLGSAVVTVDDGTDFPAGVEAMVLDLTVLCGRIEIHLPGDWKVVTGRVLERGLHLEGRVEPVAPVLSPTALPESMTAEKVVVVNLTGLWGAVSLPGRDRRG